MSTILKLENLNYSYIDGGYERQILKDLSYSFEAGTFYTILGPSGSGKTTLLSLIAGLDEAKSGTICFNGEDIRKIGLGKYRRNAISIVFQQYNLISYLTAVENVMLAMAETDNKLPKDQKNVAYNLLDRFGIVRTKADRRVSQLSGGEQQRVAIARSLASNVDLIFADEPTGNLDDANTLNICKLLHRISRTSLVVMVTHEERIAQFFADRIIRLSDGYITSDLTSWEKESLSEDNNRTVFAGEYADKIDESEGLSLRILTEDGAKQAHLTVAVLKDRIVLKIDDDRAVVCGTAEEAPFLVEGKRPEVVIEKEEPEEALLGSGEAETAYSRAGRGIRLGTQLREAKKLATEKGLKKFEIRIFLILMTVMALFTIGDYLRLSNINPETFITTDSHMLHITYLRGPALEETVLDLHEQTEQLYRYLDSLGLDYSVVPNMSRKVSYSVKDFQQMRGSSIDLSSFHYAPLRYLDKATLIYGRMPEKAEEIVVDRWLLDAVLEKDDIVQSGIGSCEYFLGKSIRFEGRKYAPVIVGICDSGEPSVYMPDEGLIDIGIQGTEVQTVSELKRTNPGLIDDVELSGNEALVVWNNAGESYRTKENADMTTGSQQVFSFAYTIEADTYATLIVADDAIPGMLRALAYYPSGVQLYCADKEAVKAALEKLDYPSVREHSGEGTTGTLADELRLRVQDFAGDAMREYEAATKMKLNARVIITLTVLVLSALMLYLVQRSRVRERIPMMAVYRLLGVPSRKVIGIFVLESLMVSAVSALPAAVLCWGVVTLLDKLLVGYELPFLLTPGATALTYAAILVLHLLVSVLPAVKLLREPPARLAAKYDF